jgi:hypothetical protein
MKVSQHYLYLQKCLVSTVLLVLCLPLFSQTKTLGLTKKISGNLESGYVLFSPIGVDTTYLINKCGQKVHTWKTQYTPGLSLYLKDNGHLLKAGTYTDTVFGFAGGRGGMVEEYDWDGNMVWSYKVFNDSLCQHHDIRPMPNGNILVLAWHSISKNTALSFGRSNSNFSVNQTDLWSERIIELKPIGKDSAEVVWQWDLLDHTIQDIDSTLIHYGQVDMHPERMDMNYALNLQTNDWIHANSLDYNAKLDQIVISAHNISEIWIIDHSTTTAEAASHAGGTYNKGGDFLYRWGNPQAYRRGSNSDRKLFRQHNARWIPGGMRDSGSIMLFNNGWGRDTAYSSVDIIRTPILSNGSYIYNTPYGPSNAAWMYTDSIKTKFYSQIISGAEMLPNGNVLICSGVQGRLFEVTANKKLVWQFRNPVNATTIQTDGQAAGNNSVFRCSFYPSSHPAFKNRTLSSFGTMERSSYPYSCTYENIPPVVSAFSPKSNEVNVKQNATLQVKFSESVLKRNSSINIYSNNVFLESISISSDLIKIKNDSMFISHIKPFPVNSRIAVVLPIGLVSDSSNNLLKKGIDSAVWHFNTISIAPKITSNFPAHQTNMVALNVVPQLVYNEKIYKRNTGNVTIYENGNIKEIIPIASSRISITNNTVRIMPIVQFGSNALVSIAMDSCFVDTFGTNAANLNYADWYFRTYQYPSVVSYTPSKNAINIKTNANLSVTFDRDLTLDSVKNILVYENKVLKESISMSDTSVHFDGRVLRFTPKNRFNKGSRIGIKLPGNALLDTFGKYYAGVDTGSWFFAIEKASNVQQESKFNYAKVYPVPSEGSVTINSDFTINSVVLFDLKGSIIECNLIKVSEKVYQINNLPKGICTLLVNGNIALRIVNE